MDASNRRKFPRVETQIKATLEITAPGKTYSPFLFHGVITDLSIGGFGMTIPLMPHSVYRALPRGARQAHVVAYLPGTESKQRLSGRIAWMVIDERCDPPQCVLGTDISLLSPDMRREIEEALHLLANQVVKVGAR